MTPPDHVGDDPVPHAGGGSQGLSTARLTGLLNGTYAQKANLPVNVKDAPYNAKGDGVTDDTAAIAAVMAANPVGAYFPPGTYLTSAPVIQGDFPVTFGPGVTIKATAAMTALWQVGTDTISVQQRGLVAQGGARLDCNNLATTGLLLYRFAHFEAVGLLVYKSGKYGYVIGDPASPSIGYEAILDRCNTLRGSTDAVPTGGAGLWIRRSTDGEYSHMVLVGDETGALVSTDSNRLIQLHAWGFNGRLPIVCFSDQGNYNTWVGCDADSPSQYGWSLGGVNTSLLGCRVLLNTFVPDNTVTAITAAQTTPAFTMIGMRMVGGASNRFSADFGGSGGTAGSTIIGCDKVNVVTQQVERDVFRGNLVLRSAFSTVNTSSVAVNVRDASSNSYFAVNTTSSKLVSINNSADINGYSGSFSGEKWRIFGASGAIRPGAAVTGSRPAAATVGVGAMFYDTTLGKPIWSDGTNWKDAAGSTV